jgi:hypothetical protein
MTHSICCIQCIGPSHPLPRLGTFHVTERGAGEPEPENDDGVKKLPHAFGDGRRHSHCPPALRTLFPAAVAPLQPWLRDGEPPRCRSSSMSSSSLRSSFPQLPSTVKRTIATISSGANSTLFSVSVIPSIA